MGLAYQSWVNLTILGPLKILKFQISRVWTQNTLLERECLIALINEKERGILNTPKLIFNNQGTRKRKGNHKMRRVGVVNFKF